MKTFYIKPTNGRKSFNYKCHVNQYTVEEADGIETTYSDLVSFGKRVAHYNHNTNEISVYGWFSATTARHINAFLSFYGFDEINKEEMENYK